MYNSKTDTAILLFSNTSTYEAIEKQIANSEHLFEYLHNKAFDKAQKTNLNVLHFNEKNQIGNTFGERISNAIASVFNKGYKNVIVIGNDSPELHVNHIIDANKNLEKGKNTIGPSLDGGVYLFSIAKHQFHKDKFAALPWKTSKLSKSLRIFLRSGNTYVQLLESLKDIDSGKDLLYFSTAYRYTTSTLKRIILEITKLISKTIYSNLNYNSTSFTKTFYNKGSPRLV
ncbi:TIGR04282 family arsenosugar biosynthesis glycosyltransferase [Tenacibaculum agarivorans]|uniref:TIGR04282 family arsenosugar biosynthesis glycosyltransferase n=1 Tax=Tenacibaculum agarivorans TaxID=1908389 RepID=UPI00094BAF90|nr:DUF2064 domain-containing protein [Tenacibaculum agarivorans]